MGEWYLSEDHFYAFWNEDERYCDDWYGGSGFGDKYCPDSPFMRCLDDGCRERGVRVGVDTCEQWATLIKDRQSNFNTANQMMNEPPAPPPEPPAPDCMCTFCAVGCPNWDTGYCEERRDDITPGKEEECRIKVETTEGEMKEGTKEALNEVLNKAVEVAAGAIVASTGGSELLLQERAPEHVQ